MEDTIAKVKELIAKREAIDAELAAIFKGQPIQKTQKACGKCGEVGHNSRSCTKTE